MKSAIDFVKDIYSNRYLIFQLTMRDVTSQYRRSRLGMLWSLIEPLAFMGILYLVFGIGLRGGSSIGMPFLSYLVTGMAALNYFNETLSRGTSSIRSHVYLLKKMTFRISALPIVVISTGIINHLIFMIAAFVIYLSNGIYPSLYWFQLFYYLFSLSVLLLGITWFTASVGVFIPDLQHIITVITRMLFYFTPVFWSYEQLSPKLQSIMKFNPLFYIVTGYRESIYYQIPFWDHPKQTLYFWSVTALFLILGIVMFKKLKPHFADYI